MSQLPRGVYQRGDSYYISYRDESGKRIRRSAGTDRKKALALFFKVRGSHQTPSGTLRSVLDTYLDRQRVYSKKGSVRNAESICHRLRIHFGDVDVDSLTSQKLDRYITKRRERVMDKTVNGDLITLRAALNHALSVGLIEKLPLKVKLLKVPRKRIKRTLTFEEIQKLLESAKQSPRGSAERYYGILLIAVNTGFRTDEILHLQWKDINWKDGALHVSTKDGIWSSKNHQERSVFVSRDLIGWLRDYRERVQFSGNRQWVFSTRSGNPLSVHNTCRQMRRIFQRAGLYEKGTPLIHLIRHTVACELLSNGTDLETVREWLGHSDISVTSVYLHTTDERKKAAARNLKLVA